MKKGRMNPMKIKISDIINPRDYCRLEVNNDTVSLYMQNIDNLPPIEINKNKKLINGRHRLEAHKNKGLAEIEATIIDIPDTEVFIESIKRNSKHGKQLTSFDRRKSAIKLYEKGIKDLKKISSLLSVSYESVVKWTHGVRYEEKQERIKKILLMTEEGNTQKEIAEKLNINQTRVSQIINESNNTETPKSERYKDDGNWIETDGKIEDKPSKSLKRDTSEVEVSIDSGFIVCNKCKQRFKLNERISNGSIVGHNLIRY